LTPAPTVTLFCTCSKARKAAQQADSTNGNLLGVLLVAGAAAAGWWWWRQRQRTDNSAETGTRSSFKFPAAGQQNGFTRGKAANNKKNKARRKEEKARRADKREK
jgi:uncharacterized protein HemX